MSSLSIGGVEQLPYPLLPIRVNDLLMLLNYLIKYHLFNS